jgi:hypothetical protein
LALCGHVTTKKRKKKITKEVGINITHLFCERCRKMRGKIRVCGGIQ